MRVLLVVLLCECLVVAVMAGSGLPLTQCAVHSPVTHTWQSTCTNLTETKADCWTPAAVPGQDAVIAFPAGSNVTLFASLGPIFSLLTFKSVIIESGATLWMQGDAIQVTECFVVDGKLLMEPTRDGLKWDASGNPLADKYLKDPSQPLGTDCAMVAGGFVPRVCGVGKMRITGSVALSRYYSSLWLGTLITSTGSLTADFGSFLWGAITNYGTFKTLQYVYMHGFLYNYNEAVTAAIAFDRWTESEKHVEGPPLLIENHKHIIFGQSLITTNTPDSKTWKAVLVNYEDAVFLGNWAYTDFDVFNFATVTWNVDAYVTYRKMFDGRGSWVNRGKFVANETKVYLSTYHGLENSQLITLNGGEFNFGNGAVDAKALTVCLVAPAVPAAQQPRPPTILESAGCWWYGRFCYPQPYVWQAAETPQKKTPLPRSTILFKIARAIEDAAIPSPCLDRYTFGDVFIGGDGTGAVVTTLPSNVYGTVTIGKGGKWIMIAEHHTSPVWGAGTVRVAKLGELHVGIDATLDNHNSFVVEEGGLMTVPKHADVSLTNTTLTIRRGGILHVDGVLHHDAKASELNQCGMLRGAGSLLPGTPKKSCW